MSKRLITKAQRYAEEHRLQVRLISLSIPRGTRPLAPLRRRLVAKMKLHADTADLLDKLVDALSEKADKGSS